MYNSLPNILFLLKFINIYICTFEKVRIQCWMDCTVHLYYRDCIIHMIKKF
ncbi:hypothetical protein ACFW04_007691 [Cataglyphis niger]